MNNRHQFFHPPSASRRAGFTVIEVIVALTGMVLIGGIVLQIYDETQAAAQKMVRRQSAIDFAVSFLDQSSELLRNSVRPDNLDIEVQPAFASDRLTVPSFGDPASNGLFLVTLRPSDDPEDGRPYETVRKSLAGNGSVEESETANAFGYALSAGVPSVSFRYATEAKPGGPVAYVDRLPPGAWPALVEIAVEVPTGSEGDAPIKMKTAVIPGRLAALAVAAPTPTPTPIPGSSLTEAVAKNASPAAVEDTSTTAGAGADVAPPEAAPTEAAP